LKTKTSSTQLTNGSCNRFFVVFAEIKAQIFTVQMVVRGKSGKFYGVNASGNKN
jgi:hypothetical protein